MVYCAEKKNRFLNGSRFKRSEKNAEKFYSISSSLDCFFSAIVHMCLSPRIWLECDLRGGKIIWKAGKFNFKPVTFITKFVSVPKNNFNLWTF